MTDKEYEPIDAQDCYYEMDLEAGEPCYACGGSGEYHDCGEDTCCCADPETQDMYDCEECNGTGRL